MSDQQVKDLFETAVSTIGPDRLDLDAMVRGGTRRHRIRTVSTMGVAVGSVAVVVGVLLALLPAVTETALPVGPSPSQRSAGPGIALSLPTSTWKHGDLGRQALLVATLALSPEGCIVNGVGPGATALVWPAGYTAERFGGLAVIRAQGGQIVAQTGQKVGLGGGGGPASGKCIDGYAGPFYVEQDPPFGTNQATALGKVAVPNLIGLSVADARAIINAVGLTVGPVTTQPDSPAPSGTVTAMAPASATTVPLGTLVDLTVSGGSSSALQTVLRGMVISAPTCEAAGSGRPRLDVIPGQVIRYIVCPPVLNAGTPPTGKPVTVTPDEGKAFTDLDTALRVPADTTPIDVCVTKAELPRVVIAVTSGGAWSASLPVDACGFRLPAIAALLVRY